jgi:two-component system LytT family sensor kinase
MRIASPIRELVNYSLALTFGLALTFVILINIHDFDLGLSLYRSLTGAWVLLSTAAVSIAFILLFGSDANGEYGGRQGLRFALGTLISMGVLYVNQLIRMEFEQIPMVKDRLTVYETAYLLDGWQLFVVLFLSSVVVYGVVHLFHNFILSQYIRTQNEREIAQLRTANAETTNQLLRQQVQPHFLFNALNVLKTLIRKDPDQAQVYLLRLSDFLRTSFTQNKKSTSTLIEEIKICQDYLTMQKMRFGEALHIDMSIPPEFHDAKLPFFSLQPLVENAIKHNQLTEESPLYIRIWVEDGLLHVRNNLQRKWSVEDSTGNGLQNLSERYHLLTGKSLRVEDDGTYFMVTFCCLTDEYRNR